ncbi:hypothetical protein [Brevibacterium litoralis]|uniref:hypothetical protein n=1 Tax=Brevibacterium litoralis TaxID=3138935 RepID=UPI0032EDB276
MVIRTTRTSGRPPWRGTGVRACVLAVVLGLVGCASGAGASGGGVDAEPGDPDAPVSTTSATTPGPDDPRDPGDPDPALAGPTPDPALPIATPRTDMMHEHWHEPGAYTFRVTGDDTVLVAFVGGVEECYGARAVVEEDPDEIRIGVVTGTIPETSDACIDLGVPLQLEVTTVDPIGDREIVGLAGP